MGILERFIVLAPPLRTDWSALLMLPTNRIAGTSRCGGSLVNEWYVVTAGHCVARARASQVRVTLGEYVLKSSAEPLPGRTYGVSKIKVHPYFKFTPQADR